MRCFHAAQDKACSQHKMGIYEVGSTHRRILRKPEDFTESYLGKKAVLIHLSSFFLTDNAMFCEIQTVGSLYPWLENQQVRQTKYTMPLDIRDQSILGF